MMTAQQMLTGNFYISCMLLPKVLIIDDEEASRIIIRQYLQEYTGVEILGECKNGIEAVAAIDRLEPDLIFLDIQMPGFSGFQVLRTIVHVPKIIFTTAFDKYALKAFDSNAIDYLLKPYTRQRFDQALSKALLKPAHTAGLQSLADNSTEANPVFPKKILLESGTKMVSISIDDIIYFEADKDYTKVHTAQKNYLSNYGIGVLEQRLNSDTFLRIHRSYIVNLHHIAEVHRQNSDIYLLLKNDTSLKVSKGYIDNIRKLMY